MSDEPIRWRKGETARHKQIGIEVGGCDGTSDCASAIHIENTAPGGSWLEIHLTPEETQWVIDCLTESLEKAK